MPRGRPRIKQPIEAELLPPDENDQIKVREVKHKTEWVELRSVEESPEDAELELADDGIEDKPRRKAKDEHTKLRELLAQHNIAPSAQLRLSIERYLHSESAEAGSWADKEFLTRYVCTKEQIVNEDYLDIARKWGAGTYWFTLRMYEPGKKPGSRVVASWEKRLGPAISNVQHVNPNDPNSPQVIVNGDGQQTVMPSIKDIMKVQREALKEQLEMAKLMREAYGFAPEQQQKSEEEVLTTAILKQPEVIENVFGGLIKRFGSASKDDEPWYADVVRDAVKSGQLVQVVQVAIDRIFNGVGNLFPGRANQNGQAEMVQAPLQNQPTEQGAQVSLVQGQQEGVGSDQQNQAGGYGSAELPQGVQTQTPEEATLAIVLNNCARKVPPSITADQVLKYADLLNDQAPQYSIDGYLDMFSRMTIEQALEFVKTQPNGEAVVSLEWAKDYTEQLQKLIQENLQEGGS